MAFAVPRGTASGNFTYLTFETSVPNVCFFSIPSALSKSLGLPDPFGSFALTGFQRLRLPPIFTLPDSRPEAIVFLSFSPALCQAPEKKCEKRELAVPFGNLRVPLRASRT